MLRCSIMGQAVFDQLSLELGSTGTKRRPNGPQPKARDFPFVGRPGLTLGEAARIIREAVKDKSYRSTPLGQLVGRYLRWFRNEYGATESTLRDYEAVLARMSLTLADKDPIDVSVDDLRDVIDLWGERSPRTRQKVTSVVRAFWSWAEEQGHIARGSGARALTNASRHFFRLTRGPGAAPWPTTRSTASPRSTR